MKKNVNQLLTNNIIMKQLRLLLTLLILMIGGASVKAQTWTGSEVGEGTFYLYNVGADKFVAYGSSWGTKAIVDEVGIPVTLESNNGNFRIKTNVDSGNKLYYLGAGFFVDQAACDFTFTPVEGKTNVYNLSYMEGSTEKFRMWVTGAKTFDQISSISAGATWTLENTQWMLISQEERDAKFAAADPLDITYKYINDPNTSYYYNIYNPEQSWTSGSWGMEGYNKNGTWRDKCGEVWNKNYDVYKIIENVPNGKYRFSVQGFYRDGSTPSDNFVANAKLYANDATVDVQSVKVGATESGLGGTTTQTTEGYVPNNREAACYYFQADKYPFQSVEVLVSNNTLRFGVKKETLIGYDWTVVDKFRLYFVEPTIDAKAIDLPEDGTMQAGQWYKFSTTKESRYAITANNLSDIVYTTEGNTILLSDENTVTTTFSESSVIIPSGITYYVKASTDNNSIVLNNVEPVIADGYYFLRDAQGRYVGRGSSYNTRARMEEFGLPIHVQTNYDGITTFTFIDSNLKLFDAGNGGTVYTDNTTYPNWKVEATDGGYYIINMNDNGSYGKRLGTDGGTWMQSNDNGLVWTFEPAAEHNTYMEALKDQQAATAATDAGMEGITDRNSLKAKLESDYAAESVTIDEVTWAERYQVSAGTEWSGNGVKYYENTVSGLKPGLYKLTAKAYYRLTWNEIVDAAAGARSNVYLYGNNAKTQLYSVFDFPANAAWVSGNDYQDANGKYYPNNPAGSQAALNAGNYETELFVYVSADDGAETGTLNYGIHQPSRFGGNGQWCAYQDFTLTYYSDENIAKEEDYAALNSAITTAEDNVLGFEKGEFAPYTNIAALNALAAAKAIDQTIKNSKTSVNEVTEVLNAVSWNKNSEEMNAVFDGTFAQAENNGAPAGWRMSNNTLGGSYHSRAFNPDDQRRLSEFNETNSGLFLRFDGTNSNRGSMYFYGDQEIGYSMPLKANTTYYVKVDFAGWGSTGKPLRMNVTGPEGFTSVYQQYNTSVRADNADNTPQQFYIVFTTADAGNYVINFQTPGADSNTHNVVISNIELFKVKQETVTIKTGFVGTTYSSENALDFSDAIEAGLKVYIITGTGDNGICTTQEVEKVPAGTGIYVEGEAGDYTANVYAGKDYDSVDGNLLVGTGAESKTLLSDNTTTYYMYGKQNGKESFFRVGTENARTASAHKAYLAISSSDPNAAKLMFYVGEGSATGINAVEKDTVDGEIYNLNGQRVNNARKGVYIVNGKKVIIK